MEKLGVTMFSRDLIECFENSVKGSREKFDFEGAIVITAPAVLSRYYALHHSVPSLDSRPKRVGTREIVNGFASFPDRAPNIDAIIPVITSLNLIVCEVIV
jgi:hypothetical protein